MASLIYFQVIEKACIVAFFKVLLSSFCLRREVECSNSGKN